MKKIIILMALALAGGIIGYGTGKIENADNFMLITNTILGAGFFWILGFFLSLKQYSVLFGPIVGLLISVGTDLAAGSEIVARNKLLYLCMGLIIVLVLSFWKVALVSGIIGGIIGFVWGLNDVRWFGNVRLEPGILNASLMAIEFSMVGMCVSCLFIGFILIKYKDYFARVSEQSRRDSTRNAKKTK